nr:MAG TPA: hypothetical protein [Caudoviricetes sp.]
MIYYIHKSRTATTTTAKLNLTAILIYLWG